MRVLILGAGLAAHLANSAFKGEEVAVLDEESRTNINYIPPEKLAVFRFKTANISNYLSIPLQKVQVQKSICLSQGQLVDQPTIAANNAYSYKTSGTILPKSLMDCGIVERYVIPGVHNKGLYINPPISNLVKYKKILKIDKGSMIIKDTSDNIRPIDYDICINTAPIRWLVDILAGGSPFEAYSLPIFITKFDLTLNSKVYQTIYFPFMYPHRYLYRATLEGHYMIIESMAWFESKKDTDMVIDRVMKEFGLSGSDVWKESLSTRHLVSGKLIPSNDMERKGLIRMLTMDYNIYSLGRFAIWKPIKIDEIIQDLQRIQAMVHYDKISQQYHNALAKQEGDE